MCSYPSFVGNMHRAVWMFVLVSMLPVVIGYCYNGADCRGQNCVTDSQGDKNCVCPNDGGPYGGGYGGDYCCAVVNGAVCAPGAICKAGGFCHCPQNSAGVTCSQLFPLPYHGCDNISGLCTCPSVLLGGPACDIACSCNQATGATTKCDISGQCVCQAGFGGAYCCPIIGGVLCGGKSCLSGGVCG